MRCCARWLPLLPAAAAAAAAPAAPALTSWALPPLAQHLGYFNNASAPSNRGFDEFYGYWEGESDYYTHEIGAPSFLDLHHNLDIDKTQGGVYSTTLFEAKIEVLALQHKQ